MSRNRILFAGVILVLLLILGAATWWCLRPKSPEEVDAAELVPGDTLVFASIPDADALIEGYSTSKVKTIVDNPNFQPLIDYIKTTMGDKGIAAAEAFLPYMSGQSFVALTHFDPDHPDQTGFIAALHPKPGQDDFDGFVEKFKAANPELTKDTTSGKDTVDGVDYEWLQDQHDSTKICVAQYQGWILTSQGVAPLQDWVERLQKKATSPSLAESDDYKKSIARIGKTPMVVFYFNTHPFMDMIFDHVDKKGPTPPSPSEVRSAAFAKSKLSPYGSFAIGAGFENGEIVDRMSLLVPRGSGFTEFGSQPCAFDSMKFTGPRTLLYWAASANWPQFYKDNQDLIAALGPDSQGAKEWRTADDELKSQGIDVPSLVDGLGDNSEISIQVEWNPAMLVPEAGLFIKLAKPEAWQPALKFLADSWRKDAAAAPTVTVNEINDPSGENLISLKGAQLGPFSPTLAENGPYLALFLSDNQAVKSYNRKESETLLHNEPFARQIGDQSKGASQILFLDTPKLINRAYTFALPYVSIAQASNPQMAAWLKGKTLPETLDWLAPIDAWSFCSTADDDGFTYYSVSGIGNQGLPVFSTTFINMLVALGNQVKSTYSDSLNSPTGLPAQPSGTTPPSGTPAPTPPVPPPDTTPSSSPPASTYLAPPTAPSDTAKASPPPTPTDTTPHPAPSNAPPSSP